MNKILTYNNEPVIFQESSDIKEGVTCDIYTFPNDRSKDLGVVTVQKGYNTPLQKVRRGDKTIEIYKSGAGILRVTSPDGKTSEYNFPEYSEEVEITIGDIVQWEALEDLEFYEVCYPPYEEGRFENL